jgi:hypothetical protein
VNTISCFLRSAAIITSLVLITSHTAYAQQPNTAAASSDASAIARALRDVDVKMTNPDPEMRIGYFESIVAEGNARKTERAIRIAVTSQDEGLRVLGFRAYVASTGSIPFDIQLTPRKNRLGKLTSAVKAMRGCRSIWASSAGQTVGSMLCSSRPR